MKNTSIRFLLAFGFTILTGFAVFVALLSLFKTIVTIDTLNEINDINSVKQRYAINFRGSVHDRSIAIRDVVLSKNENNLPNLIAHIERLQQFYLESEENMKMNFIAKNLFNHDELRIFKNIEATQQKALPMIQRIIQLKQKQSHTEMEQTFDVLAPIFVIWLAQINEFIDLEESKNQFLTQDLRKSTQYFRIILSVSILCMILFGILVGIYTYRILLKYLGAEPYFTRNIVFEIANGNLSNTITYKGKQSILASISIMQNKLKSTILNIIASFNKINEVIQKVSKASHETIKLNDMHGEITQEIQEINKSIKNINDSAKNTELNTKKSLEFSIQGVSTINQTAQEIQKISHITNNSILSIKELERHSIEITTMLILFQKSLNKPIF